MLRYMRENTGSWIIKIILGLIVIVFIFLGMGSIGSKTGGQVATVNGEPISLDDYKRSYQNVLEQMRQRFGDNLNDELIKLLQVKKTALDRLVEERLIAQEADRLAVKVSEEELADSVAAFPAFQKDGVFDIDAYRMVLSRNRLSPDGFEQMQRRTLRQEKVRQLVLGNVRVSEPEAVAWYRDAATKVAINYLVSDPEAYTDITPTQEQIQSFYDENKTQFQSQPQVKVRYLAFQPGAYRDAVVITPEQVDAYYSEHKDQFTTPEKVEASHILIRVDENAPEKEVAQAEKKALDAYERVNGGEAFADVAKAVSEDLSSDNGGYLGAFGRGEMVKPFEDAVFALETGQISRPVRTAYGWHVIKLDGRYPASTRSKEEAEGDIRSRLTADELKNNAYEAAVSAMDAVIDGDDLEQAGLIAGTQVLETDFFDFNGPESFKSDGQAFAQKALALSVGEISDVVEIADAFYIIRPLEKKPPEVLALDTVKDQVIQAVTAKLQDEKAAETAQQWQAAITEGESLADLADRFSVEVKTTAPFGKEGQVPELGQSPEITAAAFKLADNAIHPEVLKGNDGYYVIELKERIIPGEAEVEKNVDSVKSQLLMRKQNAAYQDWMARLKTAGTIEVEPGLLED